MDKTGIEKILANWVAESAAIEDVTSDDELLQLQISALAEKVYNAFQKDLSEASKQNDKTRQIGELEALLKEADELFNQTACLCDDPDTEEWLWKWKIKYYFEETDIPVHPMPADMIEDKND